MATTGNEAVTLEQLKMLKDSVAGGKKYKITKNSYMPEYVKSEASPGEVVVTHVPEDGLTYSFYVYEDAGDGSNGQIVEGGMTSSSIDELPEVVKQAVAEIPQVNAPISPPVGMVECGWFIMPPCDVVLL